MYFAVKLFDLFLERCAPKSRVMAHISVYIDMYMYMCVYVFSYVFICLPSFLFFLFGGGGWPTSGGPSNFLSASTSTHSSSTRCYPKGPSRTKNVADA